MGSQGLLGINPYLRKGENMDSGTVNEQRSSKVSSADFLIKVMFRRNTSWQGEICRLDKNERIFFRTLFEMIMLIQEAIEENDAPKADYLLRAWVGSKDRDCKFPPGFAGYSEKSSLAELDDDTPLEG